MVSDCLREVCDALARVSVLPELQIPSKFAENMSLADHLAHFATAMNRTGVL